MGIKEAVTDVKRKVDLLAETESIDDTAVYGQDIVMGVAPAVTFKFVAVFFKLMVQSPITAAAGISDDIPKTVSFITADPVRKIEHHVSNRADMIELGRIISIVHRAGRIIISHLFGIQTKGFGHKEVHTETHTDDRK